MMGNMHVQCRVHDAATAVMYCSCTRDVPQHTSRPNVNSSQLEHLESGNYNLSTQAPSNTHQTIGQVGTGFGVWDFLCRAHPVVRPECDGLHVMLTHPPARTQCTEQYKFAAADTHIPTDERGRGPVGFGSRDLLLHGTPLTCTQDV